MTLTQKLTQLEHQGRRRHLSEARGIDLTSNDYLGMRRHPRLREAALTALANGLDIGAGGSRLLRGNHPAHTALESFAADYFATPACLFFANGFQANQAIFGTLPDRHDVILFDAIIHASARDGIQTNPARHVRITHNDLNHYEEMLRQHRDQAKNLWIAVEAVYSMDGDCAPLIDLYQLAHQYDATLIVDEAHATGIFGPNGKGLSETLPPSRHLIVLHTCGKAMGVAGGLVCGEQVIIDFLINKARGFIYSTAPMPLQAVLVQESLTILSNEPDRRHRLLELCRVAHHLFADHPSPTQIIPIILGDDHRAAAAAAALQMSGFDIRAIRPPTVPDGTARLRLSLHEGLSAADLLSFKTHLTDALG
jgi:8-amino-7-oxononanoate synthase